MVGCEFERLIDGNCQLAPIALLLCDGAGMGLASAISRVSSPIWQASVIATRERCSDHEVPVILEVNVLRPERLLQVEFVPHPVEL